MQLQTMVIYNKHFLKKIEAKNSKKLTKNHKIRVNQESKLVNFVFSQLKHYKELRLLVICNALQD